MNEIYYFNEELTFKHIQAMFGQSSDTLQSSWWNYEKTEVHRASLSGDMNSEGFDLSWSKLVCSVSFYISYCIQYNYVNRIE